VADHALVVEQLRPSGPDRFGWTIRPTMDGGFTGDRSLAEGVSATLEDGARQLILAAQRLGLVAPGPVEVAPFMTAGETADYLADRPDTARRIGAQVQPPPA
jgi:hypothetical protein